MPPFPFHCWSIPQPPVFFPVSLLVDTSVSRVLSPFPFHCWSIPRPPFLSRFTVGLEERLLGRWDTLHIDT